MPDTPTTQIRFGRILLNSAAGNLGQQLCPRLKRWCDALRRSVRAEVAQRQQTMAASDPATQSQGGAFVRTGPFFS